MVQSARRGSLDPRNLLQSHGKPRSSLRAVSHSLWLKVCARAATRPATGVPSTEPLPLLAPFVASTSKLIDTAEVAGGLHAPPLLHTLPLLLLLPLLLALPLLAAAAAAAATMLAAAGVTPQLIVGGLGPCVAL